MSLKNQKIRSSGKKQTKFLGNTFLVGIVPKSRTDLKSNINKILKHKKPIVYEDEEPEIVKKVVKSESERIKKPIKKVRHSELLTLQDGSVVPNTVRNRALFNKQFKRYNPETKRWVENSPKNIAKIEEYNAKINKIKEINDKRNRAASIITKLFMNRNSPILVSTTDKSYFNYTVPQRIINNIGIIDIGRLAVYPEIVMASYIYKIFKSTVLKHLKELNFCLIFITITLRLEKEDGSEIVYERNLGRMKVGTIQDFWTY